MAAAHAHSVHGKAWSSLHRLLDPLTQDACVFHGYHGLLTVGRTSVDEAAWWFITMERTCQAQLLAEGASTPPIPIVADRARATAEQVGQPMVGWRQFQPLHEWIVAVQPELLED